MIFKLLTLGILFYILYRLVMPPGLNSPQRRSHLRGKNKQQKEEEDGEYIDYEEVD